MLENALTGSVEKTAAKFVAPIALASLGVGIINYINKYHSGNDLRDAIGITVAVGVVAISVPALVSIAGASLAVTAGFGVVMSVGAAIVEDLLKRSIIGY